MDLTVLEILVGLLAILGATRPTALPRARHKLARPGDHSHAAGHRDWGGEEYSGSDMDSGGSMDDPETLDSEAVRALARRSDPLIHHRLRMAMLRGVPVSAVRAGPRRGIARVCFADSTVVLVIPDSPGGMGMLAVELHRGTHIRLVGLATTPEGLEMQFSAPPRMPRTLALGLDQAD